MDIPRARRRPRSALLAPAVAAALLAAGCAGSASRVAPPPRFEHDAPTLLAAGTGNLEGSTSLRLTLRLKDPGGDGRKAHRMDMSGIWDVRQDSGRMDGTLKGGHATVLSIGGVEYVSLPADLRKRTGKQWLRGTPGTRTFGDFPDVHRLAMILRTSERPVLADSGGGRWHVRGTVEREVALREIPDPTLKPFVNRLPARTAYDLWTNDAGRPVRILLTMSGDADELSGTVELTDFGARPTVRPPTADQILHKPPKKPGED